MIQNFTVLMMKTAENFIWQKRDSLFEESVFLYSVKLNVCRNILKIFIELKADYTELYGDLDENNRKFRLTEKGSFVQPEQRNPFYWSAASDACGCYFL